MITSTLPTYKKCVVCNKIFHRPTNISLKYWNEVYRCCSKECRNIYRSETKSGENSYRWTGDKASYMALHKRIRKQYGKADHCINPLCPGTHTLYHWSNISGEYKHDISDWQQLCVKCHMEYDFKKERCIRGHEYTQESVKPNGSRQCKICMSLLSKIRYKNNKEAINKQKREYLIPNCFKNCEYCGNKFQCHRYNQRFCDMSCSAKWRYKIIGNPRTHNKAGLPE